MVDVDRAPEPDDLRAHFINDEWTRTRRATQPADSAHDLAGAITANLRLKGDAAMKIYLAGPMRKLPAFNFPAFHAGAAALRSLGHEVFNPAEADENNGFDPTGMTGHEDLSTWGFDLRHALGADLAYICKHADAVVVLPGWEHSSGANAEVATAKALGLPVRSIEEVA